MTQVEGLKNQRIKDAEDVNVLKSESEQTLTKAKGVIFEKVKIIKNQELQIEAYSQQIESLKDVVRITKDLLEIRNLEVKQLENKINCMEEKVKAEKERQDLLHKKLEMMIRHNGDLKREYETQLCLFNALRDRYSERELAQGVVADIKKDVEAERAKTGANQVANAALLDKNVPVENSASLENNVTIADASVVANSSPAVSQVNGQTEPKTESNASTEPPKSGSAVPQVESQAEPKKEDVPPEPPKVE